jgi:hypothetical protein
MQHPQLSQYTALWKKVLESPICISRLQKVWRSWRIKFARTPFFRMQLYVPTLIEMVIGSLDDLRAMTSYQYQLAIQSGISDGIARSFLKEIRAFKGEMKRTMDAESVLAGAAVSGGSFIPPSPD